MRRPGEDVAADPVPPPVLHDDRPAEADLDDEAAVAGEEDGALSAGVVFGVEAAEVAVAAAYEVGELALGVVYDVRGGEGGGQVERGEGAVGGCEDGAAKGGVVRLLF